MKCLKEEDCTDSVRLEQASAAEIDLGILMEEQ